MAFDLTDRLLATEDTVAMTGIQAVVRIPMDQHAADKVAGLNTAGVISGYRGSPVGGMDEAYEAQREHFEASGIRFISGVNEDLAATVVWGSQLSALEDDRTLDGVIGLWYGKGPGVDRCGDVMRHANYSGVDPLGGVLVIAGDDPSNKSSTIPSASEWSLSDLSIPVLFPGTVQEVLDFGRYGYEMSRFCGSWVSLKLQVNVADAYATVDPDPSRLSISVPERDFTPTQTDLLLGAMALHLEEEVFGPRMQAAQDFAYHNNLDRITPGSRVGIVAAGAVYYELMESLKRLGVDDVTVYKPALIWPLEPRRLAEFAAGVDRIIVVEEKRSFIERQIRVQFYGSAHQPTIEGADLFPSYSSLTADLIIEPLAEALGVKSSRTLIPLMASDAALPNRIPYFCSGCPHNRSTVLPDGSVSGGGIGCHGLALNMDRDVVGITHMGGEGAQFVGMAPFISNPHRFQNLGDGTFAHSGSLAIRQSISAGVNITYKILYNGTVAMTGGQDAAGEMDVASMTRWLEAEGVTETVVVTHDTGQYSGRTMAKNAKIKDRSKLDKVQRRLRGVSGVTVLIYEQPCAAELRRGRRRGKIETPTMRVMINEAICEGCGHCGELSNCASVHPVSTPLGRKTRIHQESCNYDYTCIEGNCPAFISVEIDPDDRPAQLTARIEVPAGEVPADPDYPEAADLVLVGIGGTGVVTTSQIISTAALLDGKTANSLDQTGVAQKGGTVVSNLRIGMAGAGSNLVGEGQADGYMLFDLVSGITPSILSRATAEKTVAIVSTGLVPTGPMVSGLGAESFPELAVFSERLESSSKESMWLDAAGLAKRIFGSQPAANVILVGVAYQKGLIPVSSASIEEAIRLNGVAVDTNLEAFRLGRRIVSEPDLVGELQEVDTGDVEIDRFGELVAHTDQAYAERFQTAVDGVVKAEGSIGRSELSTEVTKQLFHVMAYKDEYEVARLSLESGIANQARAQFGPNAKVSFHLKPPSLSKVGYDRKTAIPEKAAAKMFDGLIRMKHMRGRKLDPFSKTAERKAERKLVDDYITLVSSLAGGLTAENYDRSVETAHLIDQVRGFDDIKMANLERYYADIAGL